MTDFSNTLPLNEFIIPEGPQDYSFLNHVPPIYRMLPDDPDDVDGGSVPGVRIVVEADGGRTLEPYDLSVAGTPVPRSLRSSLQTTPLDPDPSPSRGRSSAGPATPSHSAGLQPTGTTGDSAKSAHDGAAASTGRRARPTLTEIQGSLWNPWNRLLEQALAGTVGSLSSQYFDRNPAAPDVTEPLCHTLPPDIMGTEVTAEDVLGLTKADLVTLGSLDAVSLDLTGTLDTDVGKSNILAADPRNIRQCLIWHCRLVDGTDKPMAVLGWRKSAIGDLRSLGVVDLIECQLTPETLGHAAVIASVYDQTGELAEKDFAFAGEHVPNMVPELAKFYQRGHHNKVPLVSAYVQDRDGVFIEVIATPINGRDRRGWLKTLSRHAWRSRLRAIKKLRPDLDDGTADAPIQID